MKIKEYLKTLPEDINISGQRGLFGKELNILKPYFNNIYELKDKNIKIIDELKSVGKPIVKMTDAGVSFKQKTEPELIITKTLEGLRKNVKLYSIFLQDDDVMFGCSKI